MENEILLYSNKKGLEGVITLTRTRPSYIAGIEPARRPRGPHSLQAWLNTPPRRMQPASDCPACLHWIRACAGNTSFPEPAGILEHKNDQNIINYAWSWLVVLALVSGTRGFSLFITLLTFLALKWIMVVDIIYECADICEQEFDVDVELGMLGLPVNYTMSNASSVIGWKVIAVMTWP